MHVQVPISSEAKENVSEGLIHLSHQQGGVETV